MVQCRNIQILAIIFSQKTKEVHIQIKKWNRRSSRLLPLCHSLSKRGQTMYHLFYTTMCISSQGILLASIVIYINSRHTAIGGRSDGVVGREKGGTCWGKGGGKRVGGVVLAIQCWG